LTHATLCFTDYSWRSTGYGHRRFAELRDPEDVAGEPTQNAILIEAGNVYNSIHEPILA
jgi:hypothetical protein